MSGGPDLALGRAIMARLIELAAVSDEDGALTRLYLSPAHGRAIDVVGNWMRQAGLSVSLDPAATLVGRLDSGPGAPTLLLGSHIDTVRDAGRYDGALGVVAAIEAVAEISRRGIRLPFSVEVLAFGDEEGVRFLTTLSGSRAVAGRFDPASLDMLDADGITLREALEAFGCAPERIGEAARRPGETLAYIEVHIEQGPVLEARDLPVGIVTAINGATRGAVTVTGEAGHAGTVPMAIRRDALCAAAEMIGAIEARAGEEADLVATVGDIEAMPGAVNVIPGRVRFTLDVRAPVDAARRRVRHDIESRLTEIAGRRGVGIEVEATHDAPAVACDANLIAALSASIRRQGVEPFRLPSGAGHDAMALANLCPVGMLFVRCAGGISHNPRERIGEADADVAARVLVDFLENFRPTREAA